MAISLAALACGLLAVGMGIVLLANDNSGVPATPDSNATETSEPATPTATRPQATTPETPTLTVGGDIPLPDDLALLYGRVPFNVGGISAWDIRRAAGALPGGTGTVGLGGARPEDGPGLTFAQDESGALFASICQPVSCMAEGFEPAESFTTTFYRSNDGGVSWQVVASRPGQWFVQAAVDGEPLAISFTSESPQWVRAVSNLAIVPPADAAERSLVVFEGNIAWLHRDLPVVISGSGSTLFKLDIGQPLTARIQGFVAEDGWISVLWADSAAPDRRYLTVSQGRVGFRATVEVGESVIGLYGVVDPAAAGPKLLVSAFTGARSYQCGAGASAHGAAPAILDPSNATLSFIRDTLVNEDCPSGGTVVFGAWRGQFASVANTGSCLNVREQPSLAAPVLNCFWDGALLELLDSNTVADGTRWQAVVTPTGQDGWAAAEFLSR